MDLAIPCSGPPTFGRTTSSSSSISRPVESISRESRRIPVAKLRTAMRTRSGLCFRSSPSVCARWSSSASQRFVGPWLPESSIITKNGRINLSRSRRSIVSSNRPRGRSAAMNASVGSSSTTAARLDSQRLQTSFDYGRVVSAGLGGSIQFGATWGRSVSAG